MEHLGWGLQMTVLGMGLVFSLLALLWGLLNLILALDKEEQPEQVSASEHVPAVTEEAPVAAEEPANAEPAIPLVNGMPADLVAAILTATAMHRKQLWQQAAPHMRASWPGSQLYASRWVAAGRSKQNNNWQPRG